MDEIEYHRQKMALEWEHQLMLIPEVDAAKEAGRLLADMPRLWAGATLQERHQLLATVLDAVYIDTKGSKSIVSVKPKPAFQAVLGVVGLVVERLRSEYGFADLATTIGNRTQSGSAVQTNGTTLSDVSTALTPAHIRHRSQ